MKLILCLLPLILILTMPVSALELEAPPVPEQAEDWMPASNNSFGKGLVELLEKGIRFLKPEVKEASSVCVSLITAVLLISMVKLIQEKQILNVAETAVICVLLLKNSSTMIHLAAQTVQSLCSYGKLLFPVMTTAMAAQGSVTTSAALYTGTAVVDIVLGGLLSGALIPAVYLFLAMAMGYGATGEPLLKRLRDLLKGSVSWCLKILLTVFTTYMSITGVVSGTTDAAALKATKLTISTAVPVVGGILSDASESVLVSAGLLKNAAGVYGILALLALLVEPFLTIAVHYLMLKAAAALCSVIGEGAATGLIEDFSNAMGLLLAITGSVCLLQLISTVCFLKGVAG